MDIVNTADIPLIVHEQYKYQPQVLNLIKDTTFTQQYIILYYCTRVIINMTNIQIYLHILLHRNCLGELGNMKYIHSGSILQGVRYHD
jgi:hypothetical protein